MSLVRWLREDSTPLLPHLEDGAVVFANREVTKADAKQRRKRGSYFHYDDEIRAIIAKYSCEKGKAAAMKFYSELGHTLFHNNYYKKAKFSSR